MRDLPTNSGAVRIGIMGIGETDVEEERLFGFCLAFDEVHRGFRDLALHLTAIVQGIGPCLLHGSGRIGLPDVRLGRGNRGFGQAGALHGIAIQGAIRGFEDAHVVLIEALAGRPALLARAEVPLAGHTGGVARALEQFAESHFARLERVRRAPDDDCREPQPLRIAPGDQCRARGRAGWLDQVLRQAQTLAGNRIDAWRRHSADFARAISTDVTVADVVAEHDDDIRFVLGIRDARDRDQEQAWCDSQHQLFLLESESCHSCCRERAKVGAMNLQRCWWLVMLV